MPRLARRLLRRSFLGAALGAALPACTKKEGSPGSGGGLGPTKLALNWVPEPEFGGFYAAREKGAWKRAGFDLEIVAGGPGVPVLQMVAAGKADFGVVSADEVVNGRTRGADVLPVFAVFQSTPTAIMAHASRKAKGLADVLSGGTLAIDPGAPYAAYLKKKYGFDKTKVVPYDGGVARFLADKDFAQQCYVSSEPIAAARKGSDPQVFLISAEGYDPYGGVVIVRRALWKEHEKEVRAFVAVAREGWRAYLDEPKPTNDVMAALNSSLDRDVWEPASAAEKPFIETADTGRDKLGMMKRERWETLGKQLVELGFITAAPPVGDYFLGDL